MWPDVAVKIAQFSQTLPKKWPLKYYFLKKMLINNIPKVVKFCYRPIPASFYFRLFYMTQIKYKLIKALMVYLGLKPGWQDGRRRWIHWAMAAPQVVINLGDFLLEYLPPGRFKNSPTWSHRSCPSFCTVIVRSFHVNCCIFCIAWFSSWPLPTRLAPNFSFSRKKIIENFFFIISFNTTNRHYESIGIARFNKIYQKTT